MEPGSTLDDGVIVADAAASASIEQAGFVIHTADNDTVNAMDPTAFEDMSSVQKRYKRRSGTQDACILPSERSMPKSNATPAQWAAYHAAHIGTGGYDPTSLIRGAQAGARTGANNRKDQNDA